MADLILAGVLAWLMVFVWWGAEFALRAGRHGKVVGGILVVLGLVPSVIALWLANRNPQMASPRPPAWSGRRTGSALLHPDASSTTPRGAMPLRLG